ncbi:MAG: ATP-dependent RecD-like DNA helicase [Anaerolineae bacterium]|nr:ATP-dependent RecD-like DNA helicase [Anaerolineae bacterium]
MLPAHHRHLCVKIDLSSPDLKAQRVQTSFLSSEALTGVVERVTFYNEENGYTVVKITPERRIPDAEARDGTVAVVGVMPELGTGETVRFTGFWIDDAKYGRQFRAETCTPIVPTTEAGIIAYLSSGIVSGIGPRTAERIVDHFGARTLDVLDNEPDRLHEVPGLKTELANKLGKAWVENQSVRQTMIFLQGYGVSAKMASRIYKHYGFNTSKIVEDNPYTLADEVYGIGFIRADEIARRMDVQVDDPNRLRAGLIYALNQLARDGHVYAPRAELIKTASELLRVDDVANVEARLDEQILLGELIAEGGGHPGGETAVYLTEYYEAEIGAVEHLRALRKTESDIMKQAAKTDWDELLAKLAKDIEVSLTPQQQGAVRAALEGKVSVLTGGPGTGKTTTLRMVIEALLALDRRFALASPTGRAAKRLSEATGQPAMTIHRLLGYIPGEGFEYDEDNPLRVEMLIVDEASMIDLLLLHDMLRALKPETHLMLVGDVDQLPSVGAGNVLRDIIDSGVAHVTRLDAIFRQSEDSHIVLNAHRINHGEMPVTDNKSSDFYFFGEDDPAAAADLLIDVVANRLQDKFGVDPLNDVQVIAPMYRGPVGVHALNERLQQRLNGSRRMAEKQLGGKLFRVGDKVMQTRNNYDKEVFNGDIGRIYGLNLDDSEVEVVIDGRYVYYDFSEAAEELILAYCISTHRSQGSEYPVVVMPLLTQHYMMLQRNLLYTAVTRARQLVVLVGSRKAVSMAVKNNKVAARYSGLQRRLKDIDAS